MIDLRDRQFLTVILRYVLFQKDLGDTRDNAPVLARSGHNSRQRSASPEWLITCMTPARELDFTSAFISSLPFPNLETPISINPWLHPSVAAYGSTPFPQNRWTSSHLPTVVLDRLHKDSSIVKER